MPQLIGFAIFCVIAYFVLYFIVVTFWYWSVAAALTFAVWGWKISEFRSEMNPEKINISVSPHTAEIALAMAEPTRAQATNDIMLWAIVAAVPINVVVWLIAGSTQVVMDRSPVSPGLVGAFVTLVTIGCLWAAASWTPARLDASLKDAERELNQLAAPKRLELGALYAAIEAEQRELDVTAPCSLAADIQSYVYKNSRGGASALTPIAFGTFLEELLMTNKTYLASLKVTRSAYMSTRRKLVQVGDRADALNLNSERQSVAAYLALLRKLMERSVATRNLGDFQKVVAAAQAELQKHTKQTG